uniref:Uncharacterized protein n=1 Tax=Arundo donax TaxID=35708 RepID=A0A0A8ZYI8_ARUDO
MSWGMPQVSMPPRGFSVALSSAFLGLLNGFCMSCFSTDSSSARGS